MCAMVLSIVLAIVICVMIGCIVDAFVARDQAREALAERDELSAAFVRRHAELVQLRERISQLLTKEF